MKRMRTSARWHRAAGVIVAACLLAAGARAAQSTELHGCLEGRQEVPPVTTAGGGTVTVTVIPPPTNVVSVSGDYSGLSGSAIDFHLHGPAGIGSESATILVDASGTGGVAGTFAGANIHLSAGQMQAVLDGQTYFHIHTTANPNGEVRAQIVQRLNLVLPPQLISDPGLADSAGNPALGPKILDPIDRFNVSLDCSGAAAPGVYVVILRPSYFPLPTPTGFGYSWGIGPRLLTRTGLHARNVVEAYPFPGAMLPYDVSFVGLQYVAQGFCGDPASGGGRLSNALVQWIGI